MNARTVKSSTDTYEVLRELGRGASGLTSLVRAASTGRFAVLKELHLERVTDWKTLELFQREARLLRSLDHPGIPRYVDAIGEDGGLTALVQTFVDGETLQARIDGGAPLSVLELEHALRGCLDILAYLQERVPPVIHRDIAPRNVMLAGGRAFLIDFGSVKWALAESTSMTSVGTFGYMAPEQILGCAELASDMYGLGMTFVALATRLDPAKFAVDRRTGRVDVRRMLRLPPRLTDVLERMTRPGLDERLTDPREALRLLDAPLEPTLHPVVPRDASGAPATIPRGSVALIAGVAAVILAAGGLILALFFSVSDDDPPVAARPVSPSLPASTSPARPLPAAPLPSPAEAPAPEAPPPVEALGTATISLTSRPEGATVALPGGQVCTAPCKAEVPYGRHSFRFTQGGRTITRDVMVVEDTSLLVAF